MPGIQDLIITSQAGRLALPDHPQGLYDPLAASLEDEALCVRRHLSKTINKNVPLL